MSDPPAGPGPTADRPFTVEVSFTCPACGRRHVFATVRAEPGHLRLPAKITCPGCGETARPDERPRGGGTLHISGV